MNDRKLDLLVCGAQKAGTSSLKVYLGEHPDICMHEIEEIAYFITDHEYERGFEAAWKRYYANYRGEPLVGGKSAGAMFSEPALGRLAAHNPTMQLVAVLRNPVDRAYSAYWFHRRWGLEDLPTFEEALAAESERLKRGGPDAWFNAYRARGRYYEQLVMTYRYFDPAQVLIFPHEQLTEDPVGMCREIFATIGVDPGFEPDTNARHNSAGRPRSKFLAGAYGAANRSRLRPAIRNLVPDGAIRGIRRLLMEYNQVEFRPPPMDPETRRELAAYFQPHNDQLAALLDISLDRWSEITSDR